MELKKAGLMFKKQVRLPLEYDSVKIPRAYVADFNQDEEAILGGILGYTKEQIAACHVEPAHTHEQ